jgi:2,3-dihydroxy-p-cumate/2,3-dihydroxybenzoate 3,4-dioxygenase
MSACASIEDTMIEQLRYVRLPATNLGQAAAFAQDVLGLQPIDRDEETATFRSDSRDHTLAFSSGAEAQQSVGFEVRFAAGLDEARSKLSAIGIAAKAGTPDECALRKAKQMLWFRDFSGNRIELVVRPMNSGWRYFASRDAGVTGLQDVILRSTNVEKDMTIWCGALGFQVSDWVGDGVYLRCDDVHHRIALFPAKKGGILAVEYGVENVNLLMRNYYVLQNSQIAILHGPGRRPASGQLFLTFPGPGDALFSFVAEGAPAEPQRLPRQFPAGGEGLCDWGSECKIPEFDGSIEGADRKRSTFS